MGQYYIIANMDKKEFLHPHKFNNGMKLMEFSYDGNHLSNALLNLLLGRWHGDRVYIIGDYADLSDNTEVWYPALEKLLDEIDVTDCDTYRQYGRASLFDYIEDNFKCLPPSRVKKTETTARYVYNMRTSEVLVLKNAPVFHTAADGWEWRIAPLNLLLAMGNGRGGGDYRGHNEDLVGLWCDDTKGLLVTSKPLPGHSDNFNEFHPDFAEKW